MNHILSLFADLFLPYRCASCNMHGEVLCAGCKKRAFSEQNSYDGNAAAAGSYANEELRAVIWRLKYRRSKKLAAVIAPTLAKQLEKALRYYSLPATEEILLVPVPASRKRTRTYGGNHMAWITSAIATHTPQCNANVHALARTQEIPAQTKMETRTDRLKNIDGNFVATAPGTIAGKTVIVLDDVTTTGATLKEAARALKNAGAKRVFAFTLAQQPLGS